jgi:hypothetical protein
MLCSLCSSIRFAATDPQLPSAKLIGKHHRSVTKLELSAVSGCQLRQVLFCHGASKAVRSRGIAQGFPGESLIDLDQIYYAACDNPVPCYYARVPVRGATDIEFFRGGERDLIPKMNVDFLCPWSSLRNMVIHQFSLRSTTQADRPGSLAARSGGIRGRPIAELPDSEPCYEQIHAWMRNCLDSHHISCPAPQVSALLPTRVIDVSPTDTPDFPKVLETSRQPGAFIALSYCWGTKTRFVLESNTKTELLRGMAMDVLPPAFCDAIKVTRALGYRYL